jgi:hypothetical protein
LRASFALDAQIAGGPAPHWTPAVALNGTSPGRIRIQASTVAPQFS